MKNKNVLIIGILVVIICGLTCYIVYDKFLSKDNKKDSNEPNITSNTSNVDLNEESINNTKNSNSETTNNNNYKLETIDVSKINDLFSIPATNYDGKYGSIINYYSNIDYSYNIMLSADGIVTVLTYNDSGERIYNDLSNINSVVDLVEFTIAGDIKQTLYYMLTSNGDVYNYKIGDSENKKYEATKVENVSNVKRLFVYNWGPKKNAGGNWVIIAITNNNEYIKLNQESV